VIRIGIIGFGKMGILHATILGALPDAHVVAVCDTKRVVLRLAKKALPSIRVTKDLSELAQLGLDAIYVTTLPGSHYSLVKRIYGEGIARHVFVEKSLAASAEEADEMSRLAQAHESVTLVGYQKRFAVTFRKAKELLDDEAVGNVLSFEAYAYSSDFVGAPSEATPAIHRGGVLRDSGCHAIDLALWYFGHLDVVGSSNGRDGDAEMPTDFVSARLRTAQGAEGELMVSSQMEGYRLPEIGMKIDGSLGTLIVNEDRVELTTRDDETRSWHRHDLNDHASFVFGAPEYSRENEEFLRAVTDGQGRGPDFVASTKVEQIIDNIVLIHP
jgi:predicted dehydrogenase